MYKGIRINFFIRNRKVNGIVCVKAKEHHISGKSKLVGILIGADFTLFLSAFDFIFNKGAEGFIHARLPFFKLGYLIGWLYFVSENGDIRVKLVFLFKVKVKKTSKAFLCGIEMLIAAVYIGIKLFVSYKDLFKKFFFAAEIPVKSAPC